MMGEPWRTWHPWMLQLVVVSCLCCALKLPCANAANQSTPTSLGIGALLAFNSTIGRAAKAALELAVQDVNAAKLLPNTQLVLQLSNTNCSAFQGAAAAMNLLKTEVIAIAGPQTSKVSHFVSHMGTATSVPLVSFSATDPSLSEDQYPYFVRMTHSDAVQMAAIAGIVGYYGWREVIAVYTDDDFGNNGINSLSDALVTVGATIVYKAPLDPSIDKDGIGNILTQLAQLESRVFVVHMEPNVARMLFTMANWLKMMTTGYVWIATEAIASVLDYIESDSQFLLATQGVIATRSYIPQSQQLEGFKERWMQQKHDASVGTAEMNNVYGWYAYDTIWVIAHAIKAFLGQGGDFAFVAPPVFPDDAGGKSELAELKVFQKGPLFLKNILGSNFTGITGKVQIDQRGDFVGSAFEIVNMVGKGLRVVGYWTNETGCVALPPDVSGTGTSASTKLLARPSKSSVQDVIWPGGSASIPRGWVVPKDGRPLVIGVPNKLGYKEFVSTAVDSDNQTTFHGFCIDVFEKALAFLPYSVSYNFVKFGNGSSTPNYDALVGQVFNKEFDAVVGDVTITTKRSLIVDFTQPYTASGLVVVVPLRPGGSGHAWAFLRPFTPLMWCTTGAFFFFTGLVMWLLEHKKNRDFRGRPKKQLVTVLWFVLSALAANAYWNSLVHLLDSVLFPKGFAYKTPAYSPRKPDVWCDWLTGEGTGEKVKSTMGRAVLIIWLFVVLIIISSYTASLTSLLTVQQLLPTIQGISSLLSSNVRIGYQTGSFVRDYLMQLNVAEERLVPLDTLASYAQALRKGSARGGVGAIVDELPYVQLFLSSECDFTIAGQEFTKSGWGFAFPKGSLLAIDFSTAILTLAENGELQRIHDLWLSGQDCSTSVVTTSNQLGLSTFWGLFLITGVASVLCCIAYCVRMILQHRQTYRADFESEGEMSRVSRGTSFLRSLVTYIEEEEVESSQRPSKRRGKQGSLRKDRSPEVGDASTRSEAPTNGVMQVSLEPPVSAFEVGSPRKLPSVAVSEPTVDQGL